MRNRLPEDLRGQEQYALLTLAQPKGKTNMSAKALAACCFEPVAEQTVATDHQAPEGIAIEIQFRKDLWREYRLEALNAGSSAAQATAYASALSPEMGLAAGVSEAAPVGRGWFYHSRARVVRRTFASGLIKDRHWGKSKAPGRTGAAGASILARRFRWWNAGSKN
jgi:hypothetical protein